MVSAKTTYRIKRVLPFGIIWLIIGWAFLLTEYAVIGNQQNSPDGAIKITPIIFVFASISIFFIGCLVGILEVFVVNHFFIKRSFPQKIIGKFLLYAILMFVLMLIFYSIAASIEMKISVFSKAVWNQYLVFFYSLTHISTSFQLGFSLLISLLYAEISNNIGQNVLYNFFTGKYHRPKEESRIFMFVDMKSSTSIAETLGHHNYFRFLRAYYSSFSDAIIKSEAEVYQYVGDEIVITWHLKNGLKNNQCVRCFFKMKDSLHSLKPYFEKHYGISPDFKAALHFGKVTTGEIGALKKDIFFTGDVLNTTARIIAHAEAYNEDLLISKTLLDQLDLESEAIIKKDLGSLKLKGKKNSVTVFALRLNKDNIS